MRLLASKIRFMVVLHFRARVKVEVIQTACRIMPERSKASEQTLSTLQQPKVKVKGGSAKKDKSLANMLIYRKVLAIDSLDIILKTRITIHMGIAKSPSRVSLPRIDKPYPSILEFLTNRFPDVDQAVWEERIRMGKVLDNQGVPITFATPYIPQNRLFYFREVTQEPLIPLPEKVLFQNDEILVACKPPFLPVIPSGPYVNECLLNRLRKRTGNNELVPLHRIDRETSGLVLFSVNQETRGLYGRLFLSGAIEKTYEALSEITNAPLAQDWSIDNRLVDDDIWFRSKVVPGEVNARSRVKLVASTDNLAHFLLYPITGKKHQLRVHMSGLGFPIQHDRYYPELLNKQEDNLEKPLQLIARRVKFVDPVSGCTMEFESERKLLF